MDKNIRVNKDINGRVRVPNKKSTDTRPNPELVKFSFKPWFFCPWSPLTSTSTMPLNTKATNFQNPLVPWNTIQHKRSLLYFLWEIILQKWFCLWRTCAIKHNRIANQACHISDEYVRWTNMLQRASICSDMLPSGSIYIDEVWFTEIRFVLSRFTSIFTDLLRSSPICFDLPQYAPICYKGGGTMGSTRSV